MEIQIGENLTLNIETPCEFRAEIYRRYLENVARVLHHQAVVGVAALPTDARIHTALTDNGLLVALAKILDEYVIVGVAADMKKWRTVAYGPNAPVPPIPFPKLPIKVDFLTNGAELARGDWNRDNAKIAQAYQDYFKLYITRPDGLLPVIQNGESLSGNDAFFRRYPMIAHAVARSATNFLENIRIACQHILDDWDLIENTFFPNELLYRLTKITSTGSDSHKGGKQVLILTFTIGQETGRKLVYKPSDIEIDYRLVGNTENMRNDEAIYHLGDQQSLAELINSFFPDPDAFKLPTYRILPKNPGSGLVEANGILPIQNSYGYIEFLTHSPDHDENNGEPINWNRNQPCDWVTADEDVVRKFYRQWGRLLVMASMFSLSDLHCDNVIIHNYQPHLIDLEISFTGPMTGVGGTLALGAPPMGAGSINSYSTAKMVRAEFLDQTANLEVFDTEQNNLGQEFKRNRIFIGINNNPQITDAGNYIELLCQGFQEAMEAFSNHRQQLLVWLNNPVLKNTVARITPYPTGKFKREMRLLYSPSYCSQPVPVVPGDFAREPFITIINEANIAWTNGTSTSWPSPRPNYAIQTPRHNFADYLNCDVPSYYHRLDSLDLLNARGEKVHIRQGLNPAPDPGRDTYFPALDPGRRLETGTTWAIVNQQVINLADDFEKFKRFELAFDDLGNAYATKRELIGKSSPFSMSLH